MPNRIRPGLARTLVQVAVLLLVCLVRALLPVPAPLSDAVRRPPGHRILVAGAEIPVLPPYLLRRRRSSGSATATRRLASRVRPYLVAHEQRMRRRALVLALDGIDIGPWVIHGHRVGSPAAVAA
ncbi:hypothetical protein OG342_22130 [Streptomyces bobili]|uniref:hypothetical protein n=1 Tax=Streptomyces bobili TaxID=67280 RepID=UPI00224DEBEE|nr:hypothetical protein [Streptomyces bobili]MCX5525517.1 hypothetical protein [Streptomyces bobili]